MCKSKEKKCVEQLRKEQWNLVRNTSSLSSIPLKLELRYDCKSGIDDSLLLEN